MYMVTFKDIKNSNYSAIFHLIYHNEKLSKQEIAHQLQLSLPTITQNLVKLEKEQLIEKSGQFQSSVGRRATAYALRPEARISIGVEIQRNSIRMLAVNLLGHVFQETEFSLRFAQEDHYFRTLCNKVKAFIDSLEVSKEQVLGIGFAVQALTTKDGKEIIYGKILDCTGLRIERFSTYLDYPCRFLHDAKCAATTELWIRNDIGDAIYLSIGMHLGGAIIIHNQIEMGNEGYSGTVEHMTIDPNGPPCYCGKKGCMETFCSVSALLREEETLDSFFSELREGVTSYVLRWDDFLKHLAFSIGNVHQVIDREVILGGHLSPYLIEQDIDILHDKIRKQAAFPSKESFVHLSRSPKNGVPVGAALPFIMDFIYSI
ncbi:NagC family transcriptional regulator [Gracilibacillus dipsosauri]|uniref:NagC family transcriptional regulator n=2 Tax=Gracilibacillus dipsosauri TaxID=178340 RepID=A0A317L2U1_9BACI|nr:NagC family transcriptional regulator [Gracilibacillus dipsosauri]